MKIELKNYEDQQKLIFHIDDHVKFVDMLEKFIAMVKAFPSDKYSWTNHLWNNKIILKGNNNDKS